MKNLSQFSIAVLLFGLVVFPAQAAFNSMYVFGDALSTTTNNQTGGPYYYGKRYSNGRVWVEVLAQRQGLTINNNWSYYDCSSGDLLQNVNKFVPPPNVANALFVVWVNNSDLYNEASTADTNLSDWANVIAQSQANHLQAVIALYNKGVRTLIMPNAVDVGAVPFFDSYSGANFIRQECIAYNVAFSNTLNQAMAACPGLKIYQPNFFGLLDNVLTNAASYGLTNALDQDGVSIDAMTALGNQCKMNGLGDNYIFWDYIDPSARFHEVMADVVQQIVSPVQISQITALNGSNRLDVANVPVGLNGFVEICTNLAQPNWTSLQSITNTVATTQSIFVPTPPSSNGTNVTSKVAPRDITPPGPGATVVVTALDFYRLHFPYQWTWP